MVLGAQQQCKLLMSPPGVATAAASGAPGLGILDKEVKEFIIGRTFICVWMLWQWIMLRVNDDRLDLSEGTRAREE